MFNSPQEYINAWLFYLLGAVMLIACWWYLSRLIKWAEIRQLSRIIVAVILLVPWFSDTSYDHLAPAVFISLVDGLTQGGDAFWRAGAPLLSAVIVAIVLSFFWHLWRWRRAK